MLFFSPLTWQCEPCQSTDKQSNCIRRWLRRRYRSYFTHSEDIKAFCCKSSTPSCTTSYSVALSKQGSPGLLHELLCITLLNRYIICRTGGRESVFSILTPSNQTLAGGFFYYKNDRQCYNKHPNSKIHLCRINRYFYDAELLNCKSLFCPQPYQCKENTSCSGEAPVKHSFTSWTCVQSNLRQSRLLSSVPAQGVPDWFIVESGMNPAEKWKHAYVWKLHG